MKIKNYVLMLAAGAALAACGSSSKVTMPSDLNEQRVFFDFDKSDIREDAKAGLLGQSMYMKAYPDTKIIIEGHCDERGTAEYNLALGARRANASKAVMVRDGVDAGRIQTISYGKERPWVLGSGEEVWKWNRNTTTVVKK